jgi:CRP-like cAMP-binding protein
VPYFLGFKRSLIEKIVDRLTHQICKSGEIFINQGEVGDRMYIIYKGRASIFITKDGQETNLAVIE